MFGKKSPNHRSNKPKKQSKQKQQKGNQPYRGRCNKCQVIDGHAGWCPVIS